ncbi:hypothetical protein ACFVHW_04300 [Streptomyces sp. NPDC127110]|uniref:hypothetical protein n=1 Tax=Streptomyces sp. NPDC127110 TaxID=3345362 RepID=UPI003637F498
MTTAPPPHPENADDISERVHLFTIEGTRYGPYVGLTATTWWTPRSAHLFTRATAELIVADMHRDDCGIEAMFDREYGTLTFTWTEDDRTLTVEPDGHGRYLIGGLWPWDDWGDHVNPSPGQTEFALGAIEFCGPDNSASLPEPLDALYRRGRLEAQLLALRRAPIAGVLADFDPARHPLIVGRRPGNGYFRPLPVWEGAARLRFARDVRSGDLIVAALSEYPTPYRTTRGTQWVKEAYAADPAGPWDPACECADCENTRRFLGPAPACGRVVLLRDEGVCDVWNADDVVVVIPAPLVPPAS